MTKITESDLKLALLWMATENPYAAIVLDVMLPGFDGFELCRRLRQDGRRSGPVRVLKTDFGKLVRTIQGRFTTDRSGECEIAT